MIDLVSILKKKAKDNVRTVVIPEGEDERVLKASETILSEGLAKLILLGDEGEIKKKAEELGVNLGEIQIINPKTAELKKDLAEKLFELRKHKGLSQEDAEKLIEDPNYFACMLVMDGKADAISGSCVCSTAELMRPVLQLIKTNPDSPLVSEVSIIREEEKDRVFFMTDASLNIEPNPEQLAQMAINACDCAKLFDIEPKAALVTFSTQGSGNSPVYGPILEAQKIANEKRPDLIIDAEYQVDAAINPDSAKRKCPDAKLQGDANVIVFPNLTASNILMHSLLQFSKLDFAFTLLMGIKKPVTIMGRGASVELITNMITAAAMQANI